eukprot:TRINITY_DN5586_c0_g1_i1.p2 TRINITY_DN5586_c0_g1~~TRINITY_DN5586_c0_g1_i1.p2  ORF type:complete len:144 (-),score=27.90 TRINITY_DN5586_c0_g1_i1:884-1315(-)
MDMPPGSGDDRTPPHKPTAAAARCGSSVGEHNTYAKRCRRGVAAAQLGSAVSAGRSDASAAITNAGAMWARSALSAARSASVLTPVITSTLEMPPALAKAMSVSSLSPTMAVRAWSIPNCARMPLMRIGLGLPMMTGTAPLAL